MNTCTNQSKIWRGAYFEDDRKMHLWLIELYSKIIKLVEILHAVRTIES